MNHNMNSVPGDSDRNFKVNHFQEQNSFIVRTVVKLVVFYGGP